LKSTDVESAQSYLVIRLGAIGDVLRTLPAVRRLRKTRPDATIGWVVESWVSPVLEGNPNIDRLHVVERRALEKGIGSAIGEFRRLTREIGASNYDVALDFHARIKSGLISRFSGARNRIGYHRADATECNHLFNNIHVRLDDTLKHRVTRYLDLLGPLGIDTSFDPADTGLFISPAAMEQAAGWHNSIGRPAVVAYPGCSIKRAYNRWPVEKWIELLSRLGSTDIHTVVFWGPADRELALEISGSVPDNCTMAPKTTLVEMMAMISGFDAFVGGNTAAAHMAWLQGVPTAMFTGPVMPRTDAPLPPVPSRVLRADEYYRPHVNRKHQPDVSAKVTVDTAFQSVIELLDESRADH
jgi:ADP-heptose:LPS heptosyltransferase